MMAEKIRMLLLKEGWSVADLAKAKETSPQNMYNKLKRDNFSEQELQEIAELLNAKVNMIFVTKDGYKI